MAGIILNGTGRIAALAICGLALTGCEGDIFGGGAPAATASVSADRQPDANGVIDYGDFKVIAARSDDTIGSMAGRVGLSDVVLARYNGLPTNYILRPGERLALPDDAQIAAVSDGWTPEVVTGVLDDLPDDAPASAVPNDAPGTQLTRHRVERGETAFSIARLYGVSVTALASWNGLSGDLDVAPGRSLIIPPTETPAARAPAVVDEPDAQISEPGTTTEVALPPSADEPLPEDIAAVPDAPEGPALGNQSSGNRATFLRPVDGSVVKGYSTTPGRSKNEGIDFQTVANAPVKAAEAGEVALVSRSLGGLGTIVLIRHQDDIMTVYGRVSDVTVEKGQRISRGQTIGPRG